MRYLSEILPANVNDVPRIFCWFAIPCGLVLALISPPFQAMDERAHTLRVYQLSLGHLFPIQRDKSLGDILPESLWSVAKKHERFYYNPEQKVDRAEFRKLLQTPLDPSKTIYSPFTNTALYAPVMYLPQLPGILTGRLLDLPPLMIMYLGRITGLFGYVAMVTIALNLLPVGRWLFCLSALMPLSLYLAASIHTDGMIIGFAYLFFAICIRLRHGPDEPARNYRLALYALGVGLAMCKMVYLPCLLAIFLIPRQRFQNRKDWLGFLVAFWGLSLMAYAGWGLYSLKAHTLEWEGINAGEQILFILRNPFEYIGIVLGTLKKIHMYFLMTMVGVFGHLEVVIPIAHFISYLFVLLFAALVDENNVPDLSVLTRFLLVLIPITTIVFVMTAIYVTAVPVGKTEVTGITGRYAIALLPLIGLAFCNKNVTAENPAIHRAFFVIFVGCSMASTILTVYMRYYV